MEGCLFCRIIRKEIPAKFASESARAVSFCDINPQAPLHLLIIPKEHIVNVMNLKENHGDVLFEIFKMAQDLAKKEKVDQSGFRLVFNNGKNAGQAVDHLHLHLLANRKLNWPPG